MLEERDGGKKTKERKERVHIKVVNCYQGLIDLCVYLSKQEYIW